MANENNLQKKCARLLKEKRKEKGYTMQSVADKLKMSRRYITQIESGNVNLSLHAIGEYANAIGANVDIVIF